MPVRRFSLTFSGHTLERLLGRAVHDLSELATPGEGLRGRGGGDLGVVHLALRRVGLGRDEARAAAAGLEVVLQAGEG